MLVLQTPSEPFGRKRLVSPRFLAASTAALALAAATARPVLAQDPPPVETAVVTDEMTVTDTRLRDRPTDGDRVAAYVSVIERAEIEEAGATTLQQLLTHQAGIVSFDASGADIGRTLDLRGFSGGGVKVFLDGAPLNDPRNNSLSLELIPTAALERIEVHRGSAAAIAGGGSQAGVINLWTRSADDSGGRLALAIGEFGTLDAALAGGLRTAATDLFASASWYETDGFRDNADGDLGRLSLAAGWDLGSGRLRLSAIAADSDFGNPGALRPEEIAADRDQAPFNRLDTAQERLGQATLNYDGTLSSRLALSANLFARDRTNDILTTGRAAPVFGGFFLDSETALAGAAAQLATGGRRHETTVGLEWLDADTDARGFSTPAAEPGRVDPSSPASDNTTARQTTALYLQDQWRPTRGLTLTLGARWDEEQVGYGERLPDPANLDRRIFSELSLRAGAAWSWRRGLGGYASYNEGFLPPTVEELFSFPLFGSNPELRPEDSRSLEFGLRRQRSRSAIEAALFRIDTRDEIIFDPDSSLGQFGSNVNAGETRRQGLEMSFRGGPTAGLRLFARATLTDAEFLGGENRGRRVPLVPEKRVSLGFDGALSPRLDLRMSFLWVGDQVLDNDDANLQPALEAYSVLDGRLTWQVSRPGDEGAGPRVFLAARNLIDEEYSTRGIFAFDFSTFSDAVFLTPAPSRQILLGLEWSL